MKKNYRLQDLDCAHCAQKIEDGIKKLDGVHMVRVNFLSQRLTLEADDDRFSEILQEVVKVFHKIEPDCKVIR